ncbi:hypothetical protein [Seleniivibrio woodruffii]|uniref:hypothetical protein n=1 Tax=Seleniivibrio woodruffii TaxID=1078050 RepID=UPI0026F24393|nr:hypothetical protein [Seleniivibrio woodruffii]
MKIVNYGIDRIKFSLSDYSLKDDGRFGSEYCFTNTSRGFDWYKGALGAIGFSKNSKYCIVELYALHFIKSHKGFIDLELKLKNFLNQYFQSHSEIKITRIDVYIDVEGDVVYPLRKADYSGRTKIDMFDARKDDVEIGGSYLNAESRIWTVRRYDKTAEIIKKKIQHRYSDTYMTGVIRTEISYSKGCLKELNNRSVCGAFAYIVGHLNKLNQPEIAKLTSLIEKELQPGRVEYKAPKGNYSGKRIRAEILKRTENLQAEYIALGGTQTELITNLIRANNK